MIVLDTTSLRKFERKLRRLSRRRLDRAIAAAVDKIDTSSARRRPYDVPFELGVCPEVPK